MPEKGENNMTAKARLDYLKHDARMAIFSECGKYRYMLGRSVNGTASRKTVMFIMLNPSIAGYENDDPTIRKCMRLAEKWGYGYITVLNLFAYIATDPADLKRARDPYGPDNMGHIDEHAAAADMIVCAWGNHGAYGDAGHKMIARLNKKYALYAMIITMLGQPGHPLYLPENVQPLIFQTKL